MNKKASWFVDNLGQMILMAVGIAVGFYFIWAYILHGGAPVIDNLQKCGSLTGNNGACKETCDKTLEYEFPDVGCKGLENKCCVPKEDSGDSLNLPSGYGGGGKEYDFSITFFEVEEKATTDKGECEIDSGTSIRCPQNTEFDLPISITITNIGTEEVKVFAKPVIVVGGNRDKVYDAILEEIDNKKEIQKDESIEYITTIKITAKESNDASKYIEIYPYIICEEEYCKKNGGDPNNLGIKVTDSSQVIRVKFVVG